MAAFGPSVKPTATDNAITAGRSAHCDRLPSEYPDNEMAPAATGPRDTFVT
jgi:hypothetical protein